MKNKFGVGAIIVVAVGWAGALSYINGRFQSELRAGSVWLSSSGSITANVDSASGQQKPGSLESGAEHQKVNAANVAPSRPEEASGAGQPQELSCAQLLASIAAEADPDNKSAALERAARSIPSADLPGVLNLLMNNPSSDATDLRSRLVERWAAENAPAAAAWAAQLPEDALSRQPLVQIAVVWANTDLAGASSWASALADGAGKQAVLLSLSNEAARTDPLAALGLVSELPPSAERDDSLVHALSQWAGTDAAAAIGWAEKVPDLNLRQRLLGAAAMAAASQDGPVAAKLVTSDLLQGAEQDRAMVAVVQRWAQRSPGAAAAWLTQFPDSQPRDAAVQHLVSVWAVRDPEATQAWVRQLPEGSLRNTASAAYTQFTSKSGIGLAALTPAP
jgi:hypothetical protein